MATVNLGRIKFVWQGAYNGATAYVADDVVSYNGSSYICILASTGNLPTNATYWSLMAQSGTDITSLAGLAQGDILYYNGTAWVRLGAGTSGQVLKTNGTGANPAWTTISGDLSNSGATQNVYKTNFSTAFTTSSNSYVDTGMSLTLPTLTQNLDFLVFFQECRREDSWNQTSGKYLFSTNNGSTFSDLSRSYDAFQVDGVFPESSMHTTHSAQFYLSFTSGQTPVFKLQGVKFGGSNNYFLNQSDTKSSIVAIKIIP